MDVLVAIVDLHAVHWGKRAAAATTAAASGAVPVQPQPPVLTLTSFVDQLLVFFNAFLILNKANQLCVIGMDGTHADFVWPLSMVHKPQQQRLAQADTDVDMGGRQRSGQAASSAGAAAAAAASTAATAADASGTAASALGVNDDLLRQLHAFSTAAPVDAAVAAAEGGSKLAGALSLGLCYLNRVHTTAAANPSGVKLRSRLLVFSVCPDQPSQYVSVMNGIFSTQKQSIPVDSCVLGEGESLFLQQASHLTKGIYGRVPLHNQHALLQYLMFMYLSDPTSRQHLILPTQSQVDFRATCACHQQVVQMAVVCPVCLTIMCKSQPRCNVCATRFAVLMQGPAAGGPQRPTTPAPQTVPSAATAAAPAR